MKAGLSNEKIGVLAKALDDAIEKHAIEEIVSYFTEDCEIQLPGIRLTGHGGLRKAIVWMYKYLKEITLIPITIIIHDNIFFEKFIVKAKVSGGYIEVRQTEVLIYENDYRVSSIRLYFDRLELGQAFSSNPIDRILIREVNKAALKGLK
ncbi:MAG: nuclear transport factor 2 family protein [Dehalococcoidia bacterium]|nr:nuclear transport factor 2 family protein [Dehalococcoidia bacterium]